MRIAARLPHATAAAAARLLGLDCVIVSFVSSAFGPFLLLRTQLSAQLCKQEAGAQGAAGRGSRAEQASKTPPSASITRRESRRRRSSRAPATRTAALAKAERRALATTASKVSLSSIAAAHTHALALSPLITPRHRRGARGQNADAACCMMHPPDQ
jgi:hypothetical protein